MNRTIELRQEVIRDLNNAILDFEEIGNPELDGDYITLDYITAKRLYELLTAPSTWEYYRNDEGKARWKCSTCGKVCKHDPYYKQYCSQCGSKMRKEA
jgi:hypothetical protein